VASLVILPAVTKSVAGTTTDAVAKLSVGQESRLAGGIFLLALASAATAVGDTLDVFLQHSPDGTLWDDFVHFTQMLGNGGAKNFMATWLGTVAPATAMRAPQDGVLAAGVQQGPLFPQWRAKSVVVGTGPPNFVFSISFRPFFTPRTA
jgi:hypothetical protein